MSRVFIVLGELNFNFVKVLLVGVNRVSEVEGLCRIDLSLVMLIVLMRVVKCEFVWIILYIVFVGGKRIF